MDDAELAALEQGARALLTELGLDWIRANIEEGIAAGVHKEVLVGRSKYQDQPASLFDDEDDFQYAEPRPGRSGQRMIGNIRLNPAERTGLITQALHRVIVELPAIQEETIKLLASTEDHDTVAEDLSFLPDEDDNTEPPPTLQSLTAREARAARLSAGEFLARLREEAQL
jgi:hypothetical protein